jgi:hypothetical protein
VEKRINSILGSSVAWIFRVIKGQRRKRIVGKSFDIKNQPSFLTPPL